MSIKNAKIQIFSVDYLFFTEYIHINMKRGAIKKAESTLVNVYFPDPLLKHVDGAVVELDTDRSKFMRQAVREKLVKHGIKIPKEVAA